MLRVDCPKLKLCFSQTAVLLACVKETSKGNWIAMVNRDVVTKLGVRCFSLDDLESVSWFGLGGLKVSKYRSLDCDPSGMCCYVRGALGVIPG